MVVQIEKEQLRGVLSSPNFSLMIDKTTDVNAVLNEMIIYARMAITNFLKICELFNGTADTIETMLVTLLMSKMVGLGTDGVSVMTGVCNGVGARFKRHQPILTSIHCVCHRLALGSSSNWKQCAIRLQLIQVHIITAILLL